MDAELNALEPLVVHAPTRTNKLHKCLYTIQNFSKLKSAYKFDHPDFLTSGKPQLLKALQHNASPKLTALFTNIEKLDKADLAKHGKFFKHYIFSDVKGSAGARIIISAFYAMGFRCAYAPKGLKFPADFPDPARIKRNRGEPLKYPYTEKSFVFLPGSQCWDKVIPVKLSKEVTGVFNLPENNHGEYIRFMILDSKYKEAIDLKDVKYCHLFDPLNSADEKQAVGRGARNCGQTNLNFVKNEGWTLQVFKYNLIIPDPILERFHLKGATMLDILSDANTAVGAEEKKFFPKLMRELDWIGIKMAVDRLLTEQIHAATRDAMRGGAKLRSGKTTVTAAEERANRLALRTRRKDNAEGVMLKALADQRDDEAFFLAKYDKFNPTKFQMDIVKKYRKIVLDKYSDPNNQCIVPIENLPLLKVDQLKALAARLNDSEEEDPVYVAAVKAQLDQSDVENAPFVAPRTFPLSPIQNFITEYVSPEMKTKGLLMWHSAGSGKTCGAVSMASKNFAARGYSVVWVTRTNMIGDVAKNVFGTGPMDMICDFGNRDRIEKFRKIYNADGEIAGTEAEHRAALRRNPQNAVSHYALSRILLDQGKLAESKAAERAAFEADPNLLRKRTGYPREWCGGPIGYQTFSNFLNYCKNRQTTKTNKGFYERYMQSVGLKNERSRDKDPLYKCLIVIDEAHKLYNNELPSNEVPDLKIIKQMLHESYQKSGANSARVVLMTATPYTYSPLEFFELMNLLRPHDDQLPATLEGLHLQEGQLPAEIVDKLDGYISYIDVSTDKSRFAQIKYVDDPDLNVRITEPPRVEMRITKEELDALKRDKSKSIARNEKIESLEHALKEQDAKIKALTDAKVGFQSKKLQLASKYMQCLHQSKAGVNMTKKDCDKQKKAALDLLKKEEDTNKQTIAAHTKKKQVYKAHLQGEKSFLSDTLDREYSEKKEAYDAQLKLAKEDVYSQVGELARCIPPPTKKRVKKSPKKTKKNRSPHEMGHGVGVEPEDDVHANVGQVVE